MPADNLADRRIWIVGASSGIGEKLAHELAGAGATVIASGRDRAALKKLCADLPGDDHLCLPLDVQDARQVRDALTTIVNHYGVLDTMIYMAGIYSPSHAWDFDLRDARETVNVNLNGVFSVLHAVVPEFIRQRHGHIVLTGSVVGYRGMPGTLAYGASKAAIIHLAETLHVDLKPRNIRVQLVTPGFVRTRMTEKKTSPLPCLISAEEAAIAIRKGLASRRFEIHFPRRFTCLMKLVRMLPNWLYLRLAERFAKP